MGNLAQLYLGTGRPEQAEPLLVQALEIRRRTLPPKHPRTLVSVCNLGEYYLQTGRYGEAEPLFREALEGFRAVYEPNHRDTLEALEGLSSTLVRELKFKEAEKFAVENFQGRVARYGEGKPEISTAAKLLADLYEAWGRPEQAQIWRASLGTQARGGAALNPRPGKGQSHP